MENAPDTIYLGRLDDMIAEVAAFDPRTIDVAPRECRYLVTPVGVADWDTEWFGTKAEAVEFARAKAAFYGVKVQSL